MKEAGVVSNISFSSIFFLISASKKHFQTVSIKLNSSFYLENEIFAEVTKEIDSLFFL